MMTYAQLKAFHALAQERNFHRAAEGLHLTQPAVSIQVRNLEKDSSRILFRRSGHAIELTEDGRALFEVTSEMFEAEGKARRLLSASDHDQHRTIHLGADGPHVALDLIAAVTKHEPGIHFRVTLANAEATKQNLLSLKVDAAVMANAKTDNRLTSQAISKQSLVALIPTAHELSDRKQLTLQELSICPLVFREQGSNTQRIVDDALAARHLHVNAGLVMGSREGVKEAVVRGLGIGFVFDRELSHDPRCIGVKIADLGDSNVDMLLCLKDQRQNPLVKLLFDAAET
jgi:LysR family transcriptional regulator, low CO2-responsive transcriptional regulator